MISQIQLKTIDIYTIKRAQLLPLYPSVFGLSDSTIYTFTKQATFLRPKEQRHSLNFFQGLNTNPQNLSIFLMSESTYFLQTNPHTKQKLTKGLFHIYDIYNKWDCVVEINIPGNLKIYKLVQGKKEIVSSEEIDLMYVSSVMRALYERNLQWGRFFEVFKDQKDCLGEFNTFLKIFFRVVLKYQFFIHEDFEATAEIKGSHSLTLLLRFIKEKRITANCITLLKNQMIKRPQLAKCPKVNIFLAQLYSQQGKFSKSILCTIFLAKQYQNDPYILYYKAKYLYSLLMIDEAIQLLHHIVQFNQFQVWTLLARLHIEHKNYTEALVCLNNAAKLSKYKTPKSVESAWKPFEQIGKIRMVARDDPIQYYVKLNSRSESPLSIPVAFVEEKLKPILEHPAWKLNSREKQIYRISEKIFYKVDVNRFQQILQQIFEEEKAELSQVAFRKGLTESMFIDQSQDQRPEQQRDFSTMNTNMRKKSLPPNNLEEDLPNFLRQDSPNHEHSIAHHDNRNLSIIPELESVIENSNYEQRQPEHVSTKKSKPFNKREMNEQFFKILKAVFANDEFEKAVHEANYSKVLPVYNKLRNLSFVNNYYYQQMYEVFVDTGNYNSIVVLLAEYLDFIEAKGMRKIRKLPHWLESWIFHIIDEKGMIFLNNTLNKLNYIDEAVIQAKENAKKWKIGGISF